MVTPVDRPAAAPGVPRSAAAKRATPHWALPAGSVRTWTVQSERRREEPGPLPALRRIATLGNGELLLETGREAAGAARGGTVRILERSANRLRLECDAPDPTWLFVLRAFWPHRTVEIDGRPAEMVPAYLAFSAIAMPAGHHRVEWREEIPGLGLSIAGPLLFAAAAAWLLRRRAPLPSSPLERRNK